VALKQPGQASAGFGVGQDEVLRGDETTADDVVDHLTYL